MDVDGINGTLSISSVDINGKFIGNMTIDPILKTNGTIVCPNDHHVQFKVTMMENQVKLVLLLPQLLNLLFQ